ncbi:hypothetical protein [Streptomyces sp. NPDC048825]|uniref:hypothetical protein n=1 Tax=Streptomyces sp. NPDC048825 TaxID=3365592 RepID=UPI00371B1113
MSGSILSIEMAGLDLLDLAELQEELPDAVRELPDKPAETGLHGEPGTITALLLLTATGVQAFSAWMARRRAPGPGQPGFTIEVRPDGTVFIRLEQHTADAPATLGPADLNARVEEVSQMISSIIPPAG